jgi:hypothetical protein
MARRRGGVELDAVEGAFAEARQNLGVMSTSTGLSPGSDGTSDGENSLQEAEYSASAGGGTGGRRRRGGGGRTGRPPGRLYFRTLKEVNRAANVVFNELREGKIRPQELNAYVVCLNAVSANLRFEKQQQRTAEEERFVEQLRELFAKNLRLREIMVERGIIPPSEAVGPTFNS